GRTLDSRKNRYERFLLRREILHHLESVCVYRAAWNIYTFASREEIAAETDRLIDEFPNKYACMGVFNYVLARLPWELAFKRGKIKCSKLVGALARWPGGK